MTTGAHQAHSLRVTIKLVHLLLPKGSSLHKGYVSCLMGSELLT